MSYSTAGYDYGKATSDLARNKGQQDVMQDYGKFLGQTQYRRQRRDMGRQFKQDFPQVGSHYNSRGMWNSGVRREGQNKYLQDYQRNLGDLNFDQAAYNQGQELQSGFRDANYQSALMDLYEQFQAGRMAQSPFGYVNF